MFAYCNNTPVLYCDYSGHSKNVTIRETRIADNQDLAYISMARRCLSKPNNRKILADNSELIGLIGTYNDLKTKTTGTGLEVHHLIEKRFFPMFSDLFTSRGMMPSIILDPKTHFYYTSEWRSQFPYGSMNYTDSSYRTQVIEFAHNLYGIDYINALGGGGSNNDDLEVDLVQ
jgi:hypothetical protein